ncbi:hypothetical protein BpHYR1_033398 [Brachionus plicatilis]|uniref:Uncharacterized protein n=1 Tax=Brachionus plicatilis TaxID=10195 RepID=A0A3M7Q132_BRAPC|nr:hypothetical protein BpHYR1_033398 [Brachionus plicatilis]
MNKKTKGRRIEILDQLAKGKDNKSVAEFFSIDPSTVTLIRLQEIFGYEKFFLLLIGVSYNRKLLVNFKFFQKIMPRQESNFNSKYNFDASGVS